MGADSNSARRSQFFQIVKTELPPGVDDVVVLAHGSSQIDKFIDIVHDAGFPHDVQPNDRAAQGSDGKTVGVDGAEHMICRSAPSSALDKFEDDGRISRDIFAQIGNDGFGAHPGGTAGIVINDF